jgi:polygalacturonase
VAVTSGDRIVVRGMPCFGSHGLSIGSIGGKADDVVRNGLFADSVLAGCENVARIKSNYGTTGWVANVTFENLVLRGVTKKGIVVQQDYLNGGATGSPSDGVVMEDVVFRNVAGTVAREGMDYYVLCGSRSCRNMRFEGVSVSGGGGKRSCNFPAGGCPGA